MEPGAQALLTDERGFVTEGTGNNFFMARGGEIFTPKPHDILRGVSRQYCIELAQEAGDTAARGGHRTVRRARGGRGVVREHHHLHAADHAFQLRSRGRRQAGADLPPAAGRLVAERRRRHRGPGQGVRRHGRLAPVAGYRKAHGDDRDTARGDGGLSPLGDAAARLPQLGRRAGPGRGGPGGRRVRPRSGNEDRVPGDLARHLGRGRALRRLPADAGRGAARHRVHRHPPDPSLRPDRSGGGGRGAGNPVRQAVRDHPGRGGRRPRRVPRGRGGHRLRHRVALVGGVSLAGAPGAGRGRRHGAGDPGPWAAQPGLPRLPLVRHRPDAGGRSRSRYGSAAGSTR